MAKPKPKRQTQLTVKHVYENGLLDEPHYEIRYKRIIVSSIIAGDGVGFDVVAGLTYKNVHPYELLDVSFKKKSKYNNTHVWAWENHPTPYHRSKNAAATWADRNDKVLTGELLHFASIAEYNYFVHLVDLRRQGLVSDVKTQVPFNLHPLVEYQGRTINRKYVADFTFVENGKLIIVDVKGVETDKFRVIWDFLIIALYDDIMTGKTELRIVPAKDWKR